jgi:chromosome segregation ATPase
MKTYPAFRQTNDLQALQGRLEELEEALAKSLQNQRALQEHVEFLLENDAVLRAQLDDLEEGNRQKESILTRELEKKTEEVEMLRRKVAELGDLLQESREAMESREGQLEEKESSIRRLEALLR